MGMEEFPALKAIFDQLNEEKRGLVEQVRPLREEYDKLGEQIAPLEDRRRELAKQFRAIEQPKLADLDNQLAVLARGMGGRSMSKPQQESETVTVEAKDVEQVNAEQVEQPAQPERGKKSK